jgi:hypothetical protein
MVFGHIWTSANEEAGELSHSGSSQSRADHHPGSIPNRPERSSPKA